MRSLGVFLLIGTLAIGAFWAYGRITTWLDVFNVNEVLSQGETAVLLGWNMDPAALFVVCGNGTPKRMLASWEMPERYLNYKLQGTATLSAFRRQPFDHSSIDFPASHLQRGERREVIQTQRLSTEAIQAVSGLLDTATDYQNAFDMAESTFYFSSNETAKLGLSAACLNAAQAETEGQSHG